MGNILDKNKRIFGIVFFLIGIAAQASNYSVDVGSSVKLYCNASAPMGGFITNAFYELDDPNDQQYLVLSYTSSDLCATAYGLKPKSNIKVKVTYAYSYTGSYDHNIHVGHASYYDYVTVKGGGVATNIRLNPSSVNMKVGEAVDIHIELTPANTSSTVEWGWVETLTLPSAFSATCDDGKTIHVVAKKEMTLYLIASTDNGLTTTCVVRATNDGPTDVITPTSISIESPGPIWVGQTVRIVPTMTPSNATATLSWDSSDSKVASVDNKGNVTGISPGNAEIIVKTSNGLESRCQVQINKLEVEEIYCSPDSISVLVGDSQKISCSVLPSNAQCFLFWISDDKSVAEVYDGTVIAKKSGTTTITVTTDNGKIATCRVTVPPQPSAINVTPQSKEQIMGRTVQLSYSLLPVGAMARSVTWSSDDYAVASIDQSGKVLCKKPGTAVIRATADNGVTGTALITVPEPLFQLFVWMKNGEKTGYLSTDKPEFSFDGESIKFSTSKLTLNIAEEDLDKFTLEQVLPEHPTGVALPSLIRVGLGRTDLLRYQLTPTNAETQVTWLNSDPSVVSVSQSGEVRGLAVGQSVVKVQTSNGLRAECIVLVPDPEFMFFVWYRNGTRQGYAIDEKPEVTLGDPYFTLSTRSVNLQLPAADILRFTLEDAALMGDAEDVNGDMVTDTQDVLATYQFMQNYTEGSPVGQFDVNGDGVVDTQDVLKIYEYMQKH